MMQKIEDYALIGNCESAALVGKDGSIDWLCFPRFDSEACFAALLGTPDNGRWQLAPKAEAKVTRRYRPGSLVLETEFQTPEGTVVLTDCMRRRKGPADLLRLVRCTKGCVPMHMDLRIRFGYGDLVPWVVHMHDGRLHALCGPHQLVLQTTVTPHGEDTRTVADFQVREGEHVPFALSWAFSWRPVPDPVNVAKAINQVDEEWKQWSARCTITGEYKEAVLRSLITLRALADHDTGGIVASPTTSLPELIGGSRNWDYRYCWLRDSTFTLFALMESGYHEEALQWREWLRRAIGGSPDKMQILYRTGGERDINEYELKHLPGYANSSPVRVGNAASGQLQLDVYGEVIDSLYQARREGLPGSTAIWDLQLALVEHLENIWRNPDEGIWEVRGGRRNFTWSKIMCWVAFDRAVKTMEDFGADGPVDRLRCAREEVRREIENKGFDPELNSFVQSFGSKDLDASLLMIPLVGFLPADDPRVLGTVKGIEKNLICDGFVERYKTESQVDGLKDGEGAFLPCSFWLADNYILQGRHDEARGLFEKLLSLRNDVGLLSEEYDPARKQLVGNFPQAFSHVPLVNTALNLTRKKKPAEHRGRSISAG